ncbi:MAG TPA: NTP transferase domain-containing protein, partial [Pseudolabrys sp.]
MPRRSCLAIVLAAGEGTRMHSRVPKVMHELAGRTLLAHVIAAAKSAGTRDIAVVVGPDHDTVRGEARRIAPEAQIFEQRKRRGTAHAVLSARKAIARGADDILIIFGDTPLVRAQTLAKLRATLADGA